MSKEEFLQELARQQAYNYRGGCSGPVYLAFVIGILFFFSGCATKRSTESSIEMHRMQLMTERMDSMMHATKEWQQSIFKQQSSLVDSFKNSEVRDTSRVIFLGEKGDTIKEKTIIREYIEREHTSSENTETYWEERFQKTDSLLQVSLAKQEKTDSLLQSYKKETVVEKEPSLGSKLKWMGYGLLLSVIGFFAVMSAFMKKK